MTLKSQQADRIDAKMQSAVGFILRAGVYSSAALVLTGGIYYLLGNASAPSAFHRFDKNAISSINLEGMIKNILALNCYGLIQLGLLVLIATPVIRVLFSLVLFAMHKERIYVAATVIVLCVIFYSLLGLGIK
jgi:uncharacterized membrane protein